MTDQTSAHDPLGGYVPAGLPLEEAYALRAKDPDEYIRRAVESGSSRGSHAPVAEEGAIVFDYGNNIRQQAFNAGWKMHSTSRDCTCLYPADVLRRQRSFQMGGVIGRTWKTSTAQTRL